ncbi:MAG: hypothetical protein EBX41_03280 [Chitinophagia bacterium]|nr:hypothetical protein [Chitinophagia bacterium]
MRIYLIILLSLFTLSGYSQQTNLNKLAGFGIETDYFAGRVVKHTPKFYLPVPNRSMGGEVHFNFQTWGRKYWHEHWWYPMVGLGIAYTHYGIDSAYGNCIGIYPHITIHIIKRKHFEWNMRVGDGIGYVTKRYGRIPISDTLNSAIGSYINDYFSFATMIRFPINCHWDVHAGIHFNHISDASYHQPNLGINVLSGQLGIRYFPVTKYPTLTTVNHRDLPNRWTIQAKGSISFNQILAPQSPLYPVYLASTSLNRRWRGKCKTFAGIDYSYHTGIYAFQRNNEVNVGNEAANSYKLSIMAGNEFLMGRLGAWFSIGYYLVQSHIKQDIYYQKLGINYYLLQQENKPIKELFLFANLKTHKTVAELPEFGLGMSF